MRGQGRHLLNIGRTLAGEGPGIHPRSLGVDGVVSGPVNRSRASREALSRSQVQLGNEKIK